MTFEENRLIMIINDNQTIREIQEAFSQMFPGLKIEFYSAEHGKKEGSHANTQYHSDETIGNIRQVDNTADINIDPEMSVGSLEQAFHDLLGLNAQIFRRSNQLWLQTSATDSWSLKEQNRKGLASVQQ